MSINLRPWVIGGLGLAGSIWLLNGITDFLGDWLPAIVIGSGLTWVYLKSQTKPKIVQPLSTQPLTVETVKGAVAAAEGVVNQLAKAVEAQSIDGSDQNLVKLRLQIHNLLNHIDRDEIRLAVMGGKGVGKTSLTKLLRQNWIGAMSQQLHLEDTPALFTVVGATKNLEAQAWKHACDADMVMFLTDGDLTDSQLTVLKKLTATHRRTVLVFNKQDQYLPQEQTEIMAKLRDRVAAIIRPEDVIAIATQPRAIKVRQHQADGSVKEWLEEPGPNITELSDRLTKILLQEGQKLVLASSLGNAEALKAAAHNQLNALRRVQAMPRIERTQWLVAGTAFANPFPALDLLATAAINAQLVLDLSQLYQKPMTLAQAQVIAKALASLMLKLGVVEVSTQAIAAVLKTNAITYAAGGLAQGVSGAYFSRIAGLTLIEYFESTENPQWVKSDQLNRILQSVFQQNQRTAVVQLFVRQVIDRLTAETPKIGTPATATPAASTTESLSQINSAAKQPFDVQPKRQPLQLDALNQTEVASHPELELIYEEIL